jgi:hypothetical protein
MNSVNKGVIAGICLTLLAGAAAADSVAFEDVIDTWGPLNAPSAWIGQNSPLQYTHDINDDVDLTEAVVTEAWLELDFTNDISDYVGWFVDFQEFARVAYDGEGWVPLGEVDNGQYDIELDIAWLNDDGELDVTVQVRNRNGTATAWLDHSRLYGTAETFGNPPAPVPEPITLAGAFLAVTGTAGYLRRRMRNA